MPALNPVSLPPGAPTADGSLTAMISAAAREAGGSRH